MRFSVKPLSPHPLPTMQTLFKTLLLMVPAMIGLVSCQSGADMRRAYATSPDAVVSINQVDPAYRAYFRSQQGANFSVADQRKALIAAIATSRTPVPSSMPASVANPSPRRYANTRALVRRDSRADRRAVAKRGRTSASRRPLAKRGRAAANKRIARNTRKRRR